LAGIVGVGAWAASNFLPAVSEAWEDFNFDHPFLMDTARDTVHWIGERLGYPWRKSEPAASEGFTPHTAGRNGTTRNGTTRPLTANDFVGRLEIPRLRLRTTVREGTGEGTLLLAAGHIPGTSLPGQRGNVAVAAHRDTLFRALSHIQMNDLITFKTREARYTYQVVSLDVVKPKDVGVLQPGRYPELTLVTCYPFDYIGSAPDRFIVKARQISKTPAEAFQTASAK